MAPKKYFIFCIGLIISTFISNNDGDSDFDHNQKVVIGHIWEKPREETHDATEVIIDGSHKELRLICILKPPLPKTKENFLHRNELVKWLKIAKTHTPQEENVFWSDDQSVSAISLSNFKLSKFGPYSCSYGSIVRTINITVNNLDEVKRLPAPTSHADLEGVVLNIKDKRGLDYWLIQPKKKPDGLGLPNFSCPISNRKEVPTSVHRLRPEDIDIILSIGGPISAGVAANATSILGLFSSFKSISFSSGGKRHLQDLVTLPSLLKKYNPALKGSIVVEEDFTTIHYGTSIRDLPGKAQALVNRLKNRKVHCCGSTHAQQGDWTVDALLDIPRNNVVALTLFVKDIDFNTSWKLLTMSLDYGDFCVACKLSQGWKNRIDVVERSLDILHSQVPRMFVSLLLPPNVTELYSLPESKSCQSLYRKSCECLETDRIEDANKVEKMLEELRANVTILVEKYKKYERRKDFTVVIQPFWSNIDTAEHHKTDVFASDCHHLSLAGQELVAVNLWNNMFEPFGRKKNLWNFTKEIKCPEVEFHFLYTMTNSPKYEEMSDSAEYSVKGDDSGSRTSIGLAVGLTVMLICIIIIIILIVVGKQRRRDMRNKIRVLAVPWKRMKEKV